MPSNKRKLTYLWNMQKLVMSFIFATKAIFSAKAHAKNQTCPNTSCISFSHTWWKMKLLIRSLFTEIRKVLTIYNLPIYKLRSEDIFEVGTLKALFRWISKLAWLCLVARGNFIALKKHQKLWCHSILSQNYKSRFVSEKWKESALASNLHVSSSATPDKAASNLIWKCLTHLVI